MIIRVTYSCLYSCGMQPTGMAGNPGNAYMYTPSTVRPGFASHSAKVLGSIQVVIGVVCVMFQIMGIILHAGLARAGEGIWAGVMVSTECHIWDLQGKQYGLVLW